MELAHWTRWWCFLTAFFCRFRFFPPRSLKSLSLLLLLLLLLLYHVFRRKRQNEMKLLPSSSSSALPAGPSVAGPCCGFRLCRVCWCCCAPILGPADHDDGLRLKEHLLSVDWTRATAPPTSVYQWQRVGLLLWKHIPPERGPGEAHDQQLTTSLSSCSGGGVCIQNRLHDQNDNDREMRCSACVQLWRIGLRFFFVCSSSVAAQAIVIKCCWYCCCVLLLLERFDIRIEKASKRKPSN